MIDRRDVILFAAGLAIAGVSSLAIRVPGYMDAEYYFATSLELVRGEGLSEPFLWNFLDDPQLIPHPSHLYWMPLTTFLSAASMFLFGQTFSVAQLPFILLTALLAPLSARQAKELSSRQSVIWIAGLLALFPGFYLPFFLTTDAFSLYALLGGLFFLTLSTDVRAKNNLHWLFVGLLIGLASLARVDGILFFLPAAAAWWMLPGRDWRLLLWLFLGYFIVMAPWYFRNFQELGSFSAPTSGRVLWFISYDDLFSFPAGQLTASRWLANGLSDAMVDRLRAFSTNVTSLIAVNGLIFLMPFIFVGGFQARTHRLVRLGVIYLLALFLLMSLIVPYAGARGGFFHSSSAVMTVFWALASLGLHKAIEWASDLRRWNTRQALGVFRTAAIGLALLMTSFLLWNRFVGGQGSWDGSHNEYRYISGWFLDQHVETAEIVAVNNPPGFYLASGMSAVAIPNGDPSVLRRVVEKYDVSWVILEANHPAGLDELYLQPELVDWMEHEFTFEELSGQPIVFRVLDRGVGK